MDDEKATIPEENRISGGTSGEPGSNTLNGAGTGTGELDGEYVPGNPENTVQQMEHARRDERQREQKLEEG